MPFNVIYGRHRCSNYMTGQSTRATSTNLSSAIQPSTAAGPALRSSRPRALENPYQLAPGTAVLAQAPKASHEPTPLRVVGQSSSYSLVSPHRRSTNTLVTIKPRRRHQGVSPSIRDSPSVEFCRFLPPGGIIIFSQKELIRRRHYLPLTVSACP